MNEMNPIPQSAQSADSSLSQREPSNVVRTPAAIGAEVRNLTFAAKQLTLFYAVEIGRRLVEAKELVPHGEWLDWLKKETEFSQPTASRFMKVFDEYAADQASIFGAETKYSTLNNLSVSKALRLLAVPAEEREEFAAEVDAEHLSTRELEAAIRERDEAKRELEASEKLRAELSDRFAGDRAELEAAREEIGRLEREVEDAGPYRERAEAAEARVKELEAGPIDVAVIEPDPDAVERLAKELANKAIEAKAAEEKRTRDAFKAAADAAEARARQAEEKARAERDRLREQLKAAEQKAADAAAEAEKRAAADAEPYKADAERARAEAAELRKQLALSGETMIAFKLRFAAWQEAYAAMREALERLPEEQREKCSAAVKAQIAGWSA